MRNDIIRQNVYVLTSITIVQLYGTRLMSLFVVDFVFFSLVNGERHNVCCLRSANSTTAQHNQRYNVRSITLDIITNP